MVLREHLCPKLLRLGRGQLALYDELLRNGNKIGSGKVEPGHRRKGIADEAEQYRKRIEHEVLLHGLHLRLVGSQRLGYVAVGARNRKAHYRVLKERNNKRQDNIVRIEQVKNPQKDDIDVLGGRDERVQELGRNMGQPLAGDRVIQGYKYGYWGDNGDKSGQGAEIALFVKSHGLLGLFSRVVLVL